MAGGRKSQGAVDDHNKKRKREASDAQSKSKRHRKEAKGAVVNANGVKKDDAVSDGVSIADRTLSREEDDAEGGWRVSKPMGGRMLDLDPILTEDEQYLIVAYNTSIQVYSATDSLLVRRIPITTTDSNTSKSTAPAIIVSVRQSKSSPQHLWVACNDGRVFYIDWTKAARAQKPSFETKSRTARSIAVVQAGGEKQEDAVLVLETDRPERLDLVAYATIEGKLESKSLFSLKKPGSGLQLLETTDDGMHIVGALNDRLFIGASSYSNFKDFSWLDYEFYSFDAPDTAASIAIRTKAQSGKKTKQGFGKIVDVLLGGARGGIYAYRDVVTRLQGAEKKAEDALQAQKFHWHRKAVHSVKWSRDGNYMVSGGSENVLVIWQLDTGKRDYLPHLSGSIENLVVSAAGSSYVIHLDDNSVMVISTSEMKPTTYVSGIQSASINVDIPKDFLVRRNWESPKEVRRSIPTAIRPGEPSKLHVCVGNGMQATTSGDFSAPYLQSLDLETFTSVTRQPLARTQPTDVNLTNKGVPIDEPVVTHMSFSADGRWLASVDDWKPAPRDVDHVSNDLQDQFIRERHEVYLKFWDMSGGDDSAALVSRINAPHATSHSEAVLDLAADPVASCFATIGSDGMVRIWRPRLRTNNGIVVKSSAGKELSSWSCAQVIAIGDSLDQEAAVDLINSSGSKPRGSLSFSEDGSTIFAAFGGADTGVVSVIDAASGVTVKTLEGLWTGQLKSIQALSPFLIVLSDELRVYDVVGDELRYGIKLPSSSTDVVLLQADRQSRHFAVAFPDGFRSSVGIFDPEEPQPLLVRSIPHKVISLVTAPDTAGFIALDDSAQIWTINEESSTSSLSAAQPLEDLNLDGPEPVSSGVGALISEDVDMDSDDDEAEKTNGAGEEDVDMDDSGYASVIAPQHLADIFDAAPPFAGPSIEDMFYKVTGLVEGKPLSVRT